MKNSKKHFCQDVSCYFPQFSRKNFFSVEKLFAFEFVYRFVMRLDTNNSQTAVSRNYHEVHSKFRYYRVWRTAKRGTWLSLQAAMKLVDIGFIMQTNTRARRKAVIAIDTRHSLSLSRLYPPDRDHDSRASRSCGFCQNGLRFPQNTTEMILERDIFTECKFDAELSPRIRNILV